MEQQSPVSRPKGQSRRLSRLGGCLIALLAFVFGGIAIGRILVWGTVFPRHQQFAGMLREPPAIDPALPRIAGGSELGAALAGFSGKKFVFYASIPGLGDNVRITVEMGGIDGEAIEARAAAFEWLAANYAGLKPEALTRMLRAYADMRRALIEEFGKRGSAKANFVLRVFGFPAIQDMFPPVETSADMEKYWQAPWVLIAPGPENAGPEPRLVVQSLPAWNPEDTFGVVLYKGEIVYAGDSPDHQWPPRP